MLYSVRIICCFKNCKPIRPTSRATSPDYFNPNVNIQRQLVTLVHPPLLVWICLCHLVVFEAFLKKQVIRFLSYLGFIRKLTFKVSRLNC